MNNLLVKDHSELDSVARSVLVALDSNDAALVHRKLDYFWARLAMHVRAEHLHLFPALLRAHEFLPPEKKSRLSLKSVESQITRLKTDHDFFMRELGQAVKQIRDLKKSDQVANPSKLVEVREKLSGVLRRLEAHNELEESEVYRWAETLLDPAERAELENRMEKELENLPPRFERSNGGKSQ